MTNLPDECVADNLVCYYKYRYTFADTEDTLEIQRCKANQILAELTGYMYEPKYTLGIECYTKGMQPTKPHLHIHFLSKHPRKNIREQLRSKLNMVGRNIQSIKPEVLVDEMKFWRYPLKQQKGETKRYYRVLGFTNEEQAHLIDVAYSCWKQSAEVEVNKQIRREERTGKDRLFSYLDANVYTEEMTLRDCRIESYRYYIEHEDTFAQPTVKGYAYMYAVSRKIISVEEFDDLMGV